MKKVAIVYTSKFGHTKQYADWLAAHLGKDDADVINVATFNPTQLLAYKLVIFASCVYGDKMPIMDYVKKNIMGISTSKTMFLAVSWYTNDSVEAVQKLVEENYPDQFKGKVPLYVVNSGIDKKRISVADKAKLIASQVMIEKKDGRSSDDINILAIMKGYSDPTAAENLNSIKKGIEEYFNPPKKEEPKPVPKPAPAPAPKPAASIPVPVSEVKPEPKPEPVPVSVSKPVDASEMNSDAEALSSLENAFKALKSPAPSAAPAPKPVDASEINSDADALNSLENAFKALKAPKPAAEFKSEPKPEPVAEVKPEPKPEPVAEVKSEPKPEPIPAPSTVTRPAPTKSEVVSSVKSAIRAMNNGSLNTNYSPAPTFENIKPEAEKGIGSIDMSGGTDKAESSVENFIPVIGKIDLSSDEGMSWDSVTRSVEEIKAEAELEKSAEVKPAEPAEEAGAQKNSYMELFAKRRRKSEEEASATVSTPAPEVEAEPTPAPIAEVKPAPIERPKSSEHASSVDVLSEFDFISGTAPSAPVEPVKPVSAVETTAAVDMDVYDFMDSDKPKASSRALNAVQDLAKAKAEAEKEAARKAAEEAAQAAAEEKAAADNSFIEKMKQDMAALAEESQHEIEMESNTASSEEEEIDGFTFSNDIDYDLGAIEIDTPPIGEVTLETIHKFDDEPKEQNADFDLKKLQEEINASIESNKANKEKMMNRYNKKPKEEVHNPFAVQFEEDESKSKKKKKGTEIGSKRLDDPLDPDVFFSRPTRNADLMMPSDSMPEIKFRNR